MGESGAAVGVSRRHLLRSGAALGGALVWSVPVVQSLAPAAFAGAGTPRAACRAISYLAVVASRSDGKRWQFKVEADGTIEVGRRMHVPHCPTPAGWNHPQTAAGLPPGMTAGDIDRRDPCCWAVRLPEGYRLAAVAMAAGGDKTAQGHCVHEPVVSRGGMSYTFCAPAL